MADKDDGAATPATQPVALPYIGSKTRRSTYPMRPKPASGMRSFQAGTARKAASPEAQTSPRGCSDPSLELKFFSEAMRCIVEADSWTVVARSRFIGKWHKHLRQMATVGRQRPFASLKRKPKGLIQWNALAFHQILRLGSLGPRTVVPPHSFASVEDAANVPCFAAASNTYFMFDEVLGLRNSPLRAIFINNPSSPGLKRCDRFGRLARLMEDDPARMALHPPTPATRLNQHHFSRHDGQLDTSSIDSNVFNDNCPVE
ncbi:hypothetical protein JX266_008698 [Neoarthrinium moseri]|uniref:uncharacterized protein n=1 Tax=Neoarthrinium moseri TaxID=1658444 RepID=UPI001FDD2A69|nr:uncharacterized protein JN550_010141 [Neoarthrinium moseri]KAI1845151.1 hypothetical protein JX266_008698 [Neoarthrinium moseri]KAI1862616.1 hypothetical protein JN550_010141 [Neoarthrinium moseri]